MCIPHPPRPLLAVLEVRVLGVEGSHTECWDLTGMGEPDHALAAHCNLTWSSNTHSRAPIAARIDGAQQKQVSAGI